MTSQARDALIAQASSALESGEAERVIPAVTEAAHRAKGDVGLWQWSGLLLRAVDRHTEALQAFDAASAIKPDDPLLAHSRARTTLEAGFDARRLYEQARRLAPSDPAVLLGAISAWSAMGETAAVLDQLRTVLASQPLWLDGHEQFAQLMAREGRPTEMLASLDDALGKQPSLTALWQLAATLLARAERYPELIEYIGRARSAVGDRRLLALERAFALDEQGERAASASAYASLGPPSTMAHAVRLVRYHVRSGNPDAAKMLVEQWIGVGADPSMWPYAALVWRMMGDPRAEWLEGDPSMVSVVDLSLDLKINDELRSTLNRLHDDAGRFLDQSIRGGTQTDGALFMRQEPAIVALRAAVVEAVAAYIARLPAPDPNHPLLGQRRDRTPRFAGSWSVRLAGGGHHSSHVHPLGWISSALYIDVPDTLGGDAGKLALGIPEWTLATGLGARQMVEPAVGRLVLFPSTMWHNTIPFESGTRLSVAFDVARPDG